MANSFGTETPPAPDPDMGNALTSGAMPAQSQAAPAAGQQQPPLSHAEVVTGLRHADAVKRELMLLAKDPALGKSNVKSKVIDGVLRLVSQGYMQTTEAVDELSKVPTEPLMQMKWVKNMYAQAQAAENNILDHYGATSPHFGTVGDHFAMTGGINDRYEHHDHIASMKGKLRKPANA